MDLTGSIALALPLVVLAALFVGRSVKLRRERRAAPRQHGPKPGKMAEPDQEKLILIGTVAADGARSSLG